MTGIGTQIKNALGWFLTKLKGNVVNNLTSTSTDLPLSAAKGKDLQDQISTLNTNMFKIFAPIYNGSVLQGTIKPGIYTYNDGTTDKPSNAVAGMVIVKEAGNWMIRLAVDANGNIYTSIYKPGKDWGTWVAK